MGGRLRRFRLTGKVFTLLAMVACLPLLLFSVSSLLAFFPLSEAVARQISAEKARTAALLAASRAEQMSRGLEALARENMVTVNAELGLDRVLSAYLAEVAESRGAEGLIVIDTSGEAFAGKPPPGMDLAAFSSLAALTPPGVSAGPGGLWSRTALVSGSGRNLGDICSYLSIDRLLASISRDIDAPALAVFPNGSAAVGVRAGLPIPALPARWSMSPKGFPMGSVIGDGGNGRFLADFSPKDGSLDSLWVGAAYSLGAIRNYRSGWAAILGALLATVLAMSLTASAYFSRIVTRPLRELASAARGLSAGDGSAAAGIARISQDDELGDLARDFLNMSRKLAAKIDELEGTRAYLDDVINTLPSALMTVDDAGRVTRWNAAAAAMAGDAMAPGRAAWEALPLLFPLREALLGAITARRAEDLPEQRTESRSFSPRSSRHIAVSVFPLGRAAGEAAVIRLDDVTEITRKEAELRQIQKMEMLGTLSMGIAHDFNNVLMGIVGTASILSLRLEESDCGEAAELAAEARSILSIAERAKDLVRQISRISRREELSLALIDLRSSLASVMKMCASSFDKSIAISLSQPPGAAMVMADAVLIEQVILNVCVNAAHAMTIMRPPEDRQGGRLEVSLTRAEADAHFLSAHALASQGAYWILRVADSGVGMDKDTLERIFDPFFTTKGPGRGSGMGLAMAYSIVRQHGGFIEAYSELGAGSVFSVYLKEAEGKDQVRSDQADTGIIKGSGSILVVDDEETVRRVAKGMLEACGYKAILASGLPEAEAALSDPETPPRAAIIDMSMPGTSGDEVLAALRSLSPELIAFISSGYRHDPRIDKALNTGAAGFIQKPYTLSELSHALARALGQERA